VSCVSLLDEPVDDFGSRLAPERLDIADKLLRVLVHFYFLVVDDKAFLVVDVFACKQSMYKFK
jgi:hypothetical protein